VPFTAQCFCKQHSGSARVVRIGDAGHISAASHLDSWLACVTASEAKEVSSKENCVVSACSHFNF
jgi:predicted alpha/beta hydrolase family esterase